MLEHQSACWAVGQSNPFKSLLWVMGGWVGGQKAFYSSPLVQYLDLDLRLGPS